MGRKGSASTFQLQWGPAPSWDECTCGVGKIPSTFSRDRTTDKRGAFSCRGFDYNIFNSLVILPRLEAGYQVDEEANKSVRDGDAGRSEVEEQRQGVGESGVVGCELDGPADEQACECRDGRPKSCNQS